MDLKSFVSESLTQIVAGVADAKKRIKDIDAAAMVNPIFVESSSAHKHGSPSPVEFDVAVVVASESTESEGAKAGGSMGILSVVSARMSAELQSQSGGSSRNETASRLKFTVQLAQPADLKEYSPQPIDYEGRSNWVA